MNEETIMKLFTQDEIMERLNNWWNELSYDNKVIIFEEVINNDLNNTIKI